MSTSSRLRGFFIHQIVEGSMRKLQFIFGGSNDITKFDAPWFLCRSRLGSHEWRTVCADYFKAACIAAGGTGLSQDG